MLYIIVLQILSSIGDNWQATEFNRGNVHEHVVSHCQASETGPRKLDPYRKYLQPSFGKPYLPSPAAEATCSVPAPVPDAEELAASAK